jgi:hypothetical protein
VKFLVERKRHRAARTYAAFAALSLAGGVLAAAGTSEPVWQAALVGAGFLGYLLHGSRALRLLVGPRLRRDASPFPARHAVSPAAPHAPVITPVSRLRARPWPRSVGLALMLGLAAASARGQQTIFNVPSADVLDKGKLYLEEDTLWRPQDPDFAVFTIRGVYGFGGHVEGGMNVGGFVTPGRSTPNAVAAVKWQPLKEGNFALTVGAHGLFFLRGAADGEPSGFFYGHASYAFPTNTRITAGGWVTTAGFAAPDSREGALVALEQKIVNHLNLIADWYSGKNGIGYFTPGISSTWGGLTLYAGYSIKNGDSKGNATLIELGYAF